MTKFVLGPPTPAEPAAEPDDPDPGGDPGAVPLADAIEGAVDFMTLVGDWEAPSSGVPTAAPKPDVMLDEVIAEDAGGSAAETKP